jgi:hypothetical protein
MFALAALVALPIAPAAAQSSAPYKAPRTPDGVPDLQGIYLTTSATPLERPQNLGAKEFYTDAEFPEIRQQQLARAAAGDERDPGVHYDNDQFGLTSTASGTVPFKRTSLVIGPTGRIPPTLPAASARIAAARQEQQLHQWDGPENRGIAERCIYWGFEGPPMMPGGYNGNVQIVQGPGYVALMQEMIHDVRIIPTDGRPHLDPSVKQWFGDSVGHWEGDTLVVDTTNFNDRPPLGRGTGEQLHVVEYFTRVSDDTIMYRFTVTDPTVWETSWSAEFPLGKIKGPIYEYACQEGNYGMYNILSGARQAEREAAAKK